MTMGAVRRAGLALGVLLGALLSAGAASAARVPAYERRSRAASLSVRGGEGAARSGRRTGIRARGGGEDGAPAPACKTKFIIVTGGVISGIGKGITASSVGVLAEMMGLRATAVKIDPYLNCDAGTMSPFEHGEVFVLDDGGECDLDLGNYERFLSVTLRSVSNLTTGKVYRHVIEKERRGDYLGKTVQVVPHVTDAIIDWLMDVASQPVDGESEEAPDVCIVELGGTLGDIESMPFVEALRQLQSRVGWKNVAFMHVSLVPAVGSGPAAEQKTKPTQHGVKNMRSLGLAPDFLMCRSPQPLTAPARTKLSLFCDVEEERVVSVHDVSNLYRVPLLLAEQGVAHMLAERLRLVEDDDLGARGGDPLASPLLRRGAGVLDFWRDFADRVDRINGEPGAAPTVTVAMVAKYAGGMDAYHSVVKALEHAAIAAGARLRIAWVDAEKLEGGLGAEGDDWDALRGADAVLVPGGFGERGWEGKILACRHARLSGTPFLGICLGMQAAVVEFARSEQGFGDALCSSEEFRGAEGALEGLRRTIVYMPEIVPGQMGGTMRLGGRRTQLREGSLARELYGGADSVVERHRHRYEVNPDAAAALEAKGLRFTGVDDSGKRMEIVELDRAGAAGAPSHPYYVAAQFHPEYTSRLQRPSPLFLGLLRSATARKLAGDAAEAAMPSAA